jgi:hypothetical protein
MFPRYNCKNLWLTTRASTAITAQCGFAGCTYSIKSTSRPGGKRRRHGTRAEGGRPRVQKCAELSERSSC